MLGGTLQNESGLKDFHIDEKTAHEEIARCCLELLHGDALKSVAAEVNSVRVRHPNGTEDAWIIQPREYRRLGKSVPLLSYAIVFWPLHASQMGEDSVLFREPLEIHEQGSSVLQTWSTLYEHIHTPLIPVLPSHPLFVFSHLGIIPIVKRLITKKRWIRSSPKIDRRSLRQVDEIGRNALHWAASGHNEATAEFLLQAGLSIDQKDYEGKTCLMYAVIAGWEPMVRLLLGYHPNLEARNNIEGETALLHACFQDSNTVALSLLLDAGASIDACSTLGWTALHTAAFQGHSDQVMLLCERGADIRARSLTGLTPLRAACESGDQHKADCIQILLDRGADL